MQQALQQVQVQDQALKALIDYRVTGKTTRGPGFAADFTTISGTRTYSTGPSRGTGRTTRSMQ